MKKQCFAPGCSGAPSGYSTLCDIHKQTQRRHGHPLQSAISAHDLKPYVAVIESRRAKNPTSEAWSILSGRWLVVVDAARATLTRYGQGQAASRVTISAASRLVTVAESAEPWLVVRTVMAMYLFQDQQPRRFRSDEAFDFQLVRRVMRLAPVSAGQYWDQSRNRPKLVYRDVPPRVVQAIAACLKESLGAAGVMLANKEREDGQRLVDERQRLADALKGLA